MSTNPYGAGGTPTDLGRVPLHPARRAYGLRTPNSPDGWVPAYGARPTYRRVVEVATVDPEREAARLRAAQADLMRRLRREAEEDARQRQAEFLAACAARNIVAYN